MGMLVGAAALARMAFIITPLSIVDFIVTLSIATTSIWGLKAECKILKNCAECRYAECHIAECRGALFVQGKHKEKAKYILGLVI